MTSHHKSGSHWQLIVGLILLILGIWAGLDVLDFELPGLGKTWPALPTLGGLALIAGYLLGRGKNPGLLIPGLGCLLVGLFFFLITLGPLYWEDMGRLWPLFPAAVGLVFVVRFVAARATGWGWLMPGVALLLLGIFFLVITLGPLSWYDLDAWWPVFPLIFGLAFLAGWGTAECPVGLLIPACLLLAVGLIGLLFTLLDGRRIADGWPVILILFGLGLIVRSWVMRRRAPAGGR